jgi:hypothetical protein
VIVAVPLFPSLVVVIVVVPRLTPRTSPPEVTVAVAVLADDHETGRPVRIFPAASNRLTVS